MTHLLVDFDLSLTLPRDTVVLSVAVRQITCKWQSLFPAHRSCCSQRAAGVCVRMADRPYRRTIGYGNGEVRGCVLTYVLSDMGFMYDGLEKHALQRAFTFSVADDPRAVYKATNAVRCAVWGTVSSAL